MRQSIKKELTRQQLLGKGYELINKYGYHGTSIDKLISELKITKGSFYYHFKSKEDFTLTIIKEIISDNITRDFIAPLKAKGNPIFILTDCLDEKFINNKRKHTATGSPLTNFITELSIVNKTFKSELKKITDKWTVALVLLIQDGKMDGHIARFVDSDASAMFIIASIEGIQTLRQLDANKAHYINFVQQLKLYINSLKA